MNTATQLEKNEQPLIVKRGEAETIQSLGSDITFICREAGAWLLMEVNLPLNVGAPTHDHDFAESYYVLTGSLWITAAGKETVLGPGEFVHIPGGTVHGFKALTDTPTKILILQSPGDAEEFFRACAGETTQTPAGRKHIAEISADYGVRLAMSSRNPPAR